MTILNGECRPCCGFQSNLRSTLCVFDGVGDDPDDLALGRFRNQLSAFFLCLSKSDSGRVATELQRVSTAWLEFKHTGNTDIDWKGPKIDTDLTDSGVAPSSMKSSIFSASNASVNKLLPSSNVW